MKGRYWVGLLGAIAALAISACANMFLPIFGGLLALAVTLIGGLLVGYIVTQTDAGVKADPTQATNAGAVAGLIMGVGAAVGVVIGGLLIGALFSMSTGFLGPEVEAAWRQTLRSFEGMEGYEAVNEMSFDALMNLMTTVTVTASLCFGVMGIALTTGAAALTARLAAPRTPPAPSAPLPAWGQSPDAPHDPDAPGDSGPSG